MCRVQIEHWQISKLSEWTATKNEMCSPHTHAILLLCALFNYLCAPSNLIHHRLTTFDRFNQHTTHRKSMVLSRALVWYLQLFGTPKSITRRRLSENEHVKKILRMKKKRRDEILNSSTYTELKLTKKKCGKMTTAIVFRSQITHFSMMKKNVKRKYMGCVLCVWLQAMTKIMY